MLQFLRRPALILASRRSTRNFSLGSRALWNAQQPSSPAIAAPPPPTDSQSATLKALGEHLLQALPKYIQQVRVYKNELSVCVAPTGLLPVLYYCRDHQGMLFKQCMDVCGVDYPHRQQRFEINYNLLSIAYNARLRVKTYADECSPVPSSCEVYPGNNWFERECYDMYGVVFEGHPDLRRILTDYGFEGYPLRKDFPLTGYSEIRYDDEKKRIVYEPLELTQQFRLFDYQSPWEQVGPGQGESSGKKDAKK